MSTLKVNSSIAIPLDEIRLTFVRSSGPGGQNVNKVNSKVQLHWNVLQTDALPDHVRQAFQAKFARRISAEGELYLTSQRYRDQAKNVDDVLEKMAELIREAATRTKARRPTRVSRRQKQKRLDNKKRQSEKKRLRRDLD